MLILETKSGRKIQIERKELERPIKIIYVDDKGRTREYSLRLTVKGGLVLN